MPLYISQTMDTSRPASAAPFSPCRRRRCQSRRRLQAVNRIRIACRLTDPPQPAKLGNHSNLDYRCVFRAACAALHCRPKSRHTNTNQHTKAYASLRRLVNTTVGHRNARLSSRTHNLRSFRLIEESELHIYPGQILVKVSLSLLSAACQWRNEGRRPIYSHLL